MGYYSGDYYRGDYYSGDPGKPLRLLKGIARVGLAPFLPGLLPGAGRITRAARSLFAKKAGLPGAAQVSALERALVQTEEERKLGVVGPAILRARAARGLLPGMKRRRMNPYNPKALRRAVRRARSFAKMALRVIRLTEPKKLKRKSFAGFKVARKRG